VIGFKSLEKLNLNFEEYKFLLRNNIDNIYRNAVYDDQEIEYLGQIIQRTPSLTEIDLNFSK